MDIFENISTLLQNGRAREIKEAVSSALSSGTPASDILNNGLIAGMNIIGAKFRNNDIFVPEVLIAARAMNSALEILKPALVKSGVKPIGKALICTVRGDMHDIGKNLVKMMIEGKGIECIDLGVDVDEKVIINEIKKQKPNILCLSALLTTTMMNLKDTIAALKKAGVRDNVKVMIGGAPVTEEFARQIGADGYSEDAAGAADMAFSFLK
jgi:5-methyltetrahydrofolate--homocysteine methyltransferase